GVASDETPVARRWAQYFEAPMILIAFWLLGLWYVETRYAIEPQVRFSQDLAIWLFFVLESVVLTSLVQHKIRYLLSNWVNLLIIAAGVGILWGDSPIAGTLRSLRLLLVIGLLLEASGGFRRVLARHHLGSTLAVSMVITVIAGIMIAGIDPGIRNITDGIWWAWVTVTTVGYGDVVPTSTEGKIFGALLIAMGIGLFSMITASFTVYFVEQDEQKENLELSLLSAEFKARMDRMEAKLDTLIREQHAKGITAPEADHEPSKTD
ncbi:MAG: two pore domain potassium channel family protein, partial [Gammaproteobacteria bacterium]